MSIFKDVGYLYLAYAVSIIIHELGHLLAAKVIHLKVSRFVLGDEFLSVEIKGVRLSPLIFSGFVEVDVDELVTKTKKEIVLFFLAGIIGNLLLLILSAFFINKYEWIKYFIEVNSSIIIFTMIPFKPFKTDVYKIIKYTKQRQ